MAFGLLEDAENMREEKEEKKLREEDLLIKDTREFQKRLLAEHEDIKNELLYSLYCRVSSDEEGCYGLDANEWSSWL